MTEGFEQKPQDTKKEKRKPSDLTPISNPETGLTGDYRNEIGNLIYAVEKGSDEEIAESLKRRPLEHYDVRYKDYVNVVTDQNRESVSRINEIVDEINSMTDPKTLSRKRIMELYKEIMGLIWKDK
jgi:hypothetical protein